MSRFNDALRKTGRVTLDTASLIGALMDIAIDNEINIERLTDELMKRSVGVDREQAKKIATVLYTQAEDITWKN